MDITQRTEKLLAAATNGTERTSIAITAILQAREDLEAALAAQHLANVRVAQAAMVFSGAVETVRNMPDVVKAIADASESEHRPISAINEYFRSCIDINEPIDSLLTNAIHSALGAEVTPKLPDQT